MRHEAGATEPISELVGALRQRLPGWTSGQEKQALASLLQQNGIAAAPVARVSEVANDPSLADCWEGATHPVTGEALYPAGLWMVNGHYPGVSRPPNLLGEHNLEVLTELGYSAAEIEQMRGDCVGDSDDIEALG
jgi:formyl-CoA transferase